MAMTVLNKQIVIDIPNSEAVKKNQLVGIKDSTVGSYYTDDNREKKQAIIDFFDDFKMPFTIDLNSIKNYKEDVCSRILVNKDLFKGGLNDFESDCSLLLASNNSITMKFTGTNGRYVCFEGDSSEKFRNILLGGITRLIIEQAKDCFILKVELKDDYYLTLSKKKTVDIKELAMTLDNYYSKYSKKGIHLFGIEYFDILLNNMISKKEIFEATNLLKDKQSYITSLEEGVKVGELLFINSNKNRDSNEIDDSFESFDEPGYNKIFYGIPGCGKSYHIENEVLKDADKDNDVFRTTFYLDYSNSDFIGQLMPDVKNGGTPTYKRVPGPFTKALERAYEKEDRMIYLVIEEINRGNAAAIFGDVFQLLDRIKDGPDKGKSEYPVYNEFINSYLEEKGLNKPNNQIFIPSNLTILATMNTSDQNVFPLDTAFKRRWDRERVTADWSKCTFKDDYIPFTDYTWYDFVNLVNDKMIKSSKDGMILEDKQIGAFFINKDILASKDDKDIVNEENKTKLRKFVNNVIDYIYTDVSKFDRKNWFKKQVSFDDIYDAICKYEYKKDDNDQVILDTNNKPIEEYHGDKELYLLLDTIKNKVADLYG